MRQFVQNLSYCSTSYFVCQVFIGHMIGGSLSLFIFSIYRDFSRFCFFFIVQSSIIFLAFPFYSKHQVCVLFLFIDSMISYHYVDVVISAFLYFKLLFAAFYIVCLENLVFSFCIVRRTSCMAEGVCMHVFIFCSVYFLQRAWQSHSQPFCSIYRSSVVRVLSGQQALVSVPLDQVRATFYSVCTIGSQFVQHQRICRVYCSFVSRQRVPAIGYQRVFDWTKLAPLMRVCVRLVPSSHKFSVFAAYIVVLSRDNSSQLQGISECTIGPSSHH